MALKLSGGKKGLPKGKTNNKNGRPKGVPNKVTTDARKAITSFIEGNIGELNRLIKRIEKQSGPAKAFECIMSVVEYHIPKLNRVTHVGEDDKPIGVLIVDDIPPAERHPPGTPKKITKGKSKG